MNNSKIQIQNLLKSSGFKEIYENLMLFKKEQLNDSDYIKLLSVGLLLLNSTDYETRSVGYEIILNYSLMTKDYIPLYEISSCLKNSPTVKMLKLLDKQKFDNNIYDKFQTIALEKSKNTASGIYYTQQQIDVNKEFKHSDENAVIIAPTSFGKTELIKQYVLDNYKIKNICIVVPTKVLVNQVRYDLLKMFSNYNLAPKIITHYDSIIKGKNNIFVLTQERLFKLVFDRNNSISFDTLLIDEAHNIFNNKERSILLTKVIILLQLKNPNLIVKLFSPVIEKAENLQLKCSDILTLKEIKALPLIKSNKYYLADFNVKQQYYYDSLFDNFVQFNSKLEEDKYKFIISHSGKKNIIYLNSPVKIKKAVEEFSTYLNDIDDPEIDNIISNLAEYIDKEYDLISYLRKGIVYHFGGMPDNVRIYIEDCVKKYKFIKYVFCSSTLLEGVNMPFDTMFICEKKIGNSNLSYGQLKNLVGRVNRYSEIFNFENINISKLISNIYFIKDANSNDNYLDFIKERLRYNILPRIKDDKVDNPLLKKSTKEISENDLQTLINLSNYPVEKELKEKLTVTTDIGKKLIKANVIEFNIKENEEKILERLQYLKEKIPDISLIDKVYYVFFKDIELISDNKNNIRRLDNIAARNYYQMLFEQRKNNTTFKEKISRMVYYWINHSEKKHAIYVGERWGLLKRNSKDFKPQYIDITKLTKKEIINYAILRIKEEDNYIDFTLLKFVEFLNSEGLISDNEYNSLKYGTSDEIQIYFVKDGLSPELSSLIVSKYKEYIYKENDYYYIKKSILDNFKENEILLNELKYYID